MPLGSVVEAARFLDNEEPFSDDFGDMASVVEVDEAELDIVDIVVSAVGSSLSDSGERITFGVSEVISFAPQSVQEDCGNKSLPISREKRDKSIP